MATVAEHLSRCARLPSKLPVRMERCIVQSIDRFSLSSRCACVYFVLRRFVFVSLRERMKIGRTRTSIAPDGVKLRQEFGHFSIQFSKSEPNPLLARTSQLDCAALMAGCVLHCCVEHFVILPADQHCIVYSLLESSICFLHFYRG